MKFGLYCEPDENPGIAVNPRFEEKRVCSATWPLTWPPSPWPGV